MARARRRLSPPAGSKTCSSRRAASCGARHWFKNAEKNENAITRAAALHRAARLPYRPGARLGAWLRRKALFPGDADHRRPVRRRRAVAAAHLSAEIGAERRLARDAADEHLGRFHQAPDAKPGDRLRRESSAPRERERRGEGLR